MIGAFKYGLSNLANFKRRDGQSTFWYLFLLVFILNSLISMTVMHPMMSRMQNVMRASALQPGAEAVAFQSMQGIIAGMPKMMMLIGVIEAIVSICLFAACLVRRLHDADLSGYWVLLPGGSKLGGLAIMPAYMASFQTAFSSARNGEQGGHEFAALFQGAVLNSAFTIVLLASIIIIGLLKPSKGPNRFGETSVSFR